MKIIFKRALALGLASLTIGGLSTTVWASPIDSTTNSITSPKTIEFNIPVDFNSSEPVIHIIDNFEITVTDTPNGVFHFKAY